MKESEFTKGNNPLLKDKDALWSSESGDGAEQEVGDFIYGLIRLIKPKVIVETGCYVGDTTVMIEKAIKDNKYGELYVCDIADECIKETKKRVECSVQKKTGVELIKELGDKIEFAFIDSGYDCREEEIEELIKHLDKGQMFVLHDTAPQHSKMREMSERIDLKKVYFNTPRGLTLYER